MMSTLRLINENGVTRELTEKEIEQLRVEALEDMKFEPIRVRQQRDQLLAATDWTQAADVPQAIKDKYAAYRQALRDIPQQEGFPDNVVWPVEP